MIKLLCVFIVALGAINASVVKRETIHDKGTHLLVCEQEPIELGIVLDSSSSIAHSDFRKGIEFLQDFVDQYEIGDGPNDVRVSIITFGKGIYPQDAFNLTTYQNKEEVEEALGEIPHRAGLYTSTGEGIEYMSKYQLSKTVTRPGADRIGIVITDGNSQEWRRTRDAAQEARDDGIIMFAVGIGRVRDQELENIAGNLSRVVKVKNYGQLHDIKASLARQTCIKKEKPTTTPPPQTATCGEENPADIYFAFSPAELGLAATSWTSSFVSITAKQDALEDGFRFGVVSGSCPDDEGFDLDDYSSAEAIEERMTGYLMPRMSALVQRLTSTGYTATSGGRADARDVAVLVANGGKRNKGLAAEVERLVAAGVEVFIADPIGSGVNIDGAITLTGRSAKEASANLVNYLCPPRT
ncbi:collagen alpha-1(XXI) chain [Aplysia californica]|uniref:Collagen alpha-1(XXI) chain n=1 Tax=Aplysia californica TaxID=6500 RepID=A0ABM1A8D8_APLCA|nr:collagen alpha-1(XXI) chain [Aplysia californica]